MTKISDLYNQWMHDPEYRAAYDSLEEEFTLAYALIRARAGLTQQERKQPIGCGPVGRRAGHAHDAHP